jgi:hypothetical protein
MSPAVFPERHCLMSTWKRSCTWRSLFAKRSLSGPVFFEEYLADDAILDGQQLKNRVVEA